MRHILENLTASDVDALAGLATDINDRLSFGQTLWVRNEHFESTGQWLKTGGQYGFALTLTALNHTHRDEVEGLEMTLVGHSESGEAIEKVVRLSPVGTAVISGLPALKSVQIVFDFEQIRQHSRRKAEPKDDIGYPIPFPSTSGALSAAAAPHRDPIVLMQGPDFLIQARLMENGRVDLLLDRMKADRVGVAVKGTFTFRIEPAGVDVDFILGERHLAPDCEQCVSTDHGLSQSDLWGDSAQIHTACLIKTPEGHRTDG